MHVLSVKLRIVILLFIFCRTHGKVTVENGAYKDILVRFSPRVNSEDGGMLLEKMKEVLTETSEILGKAVRLKISNVIFLLPRSWDISKLVNLTVGKATPENTVFPPDILIDNVSNSAFGNYPFALQYGGCMVPGRQISIQENFLTNEEDFPKGKLLAREWLKFYFGVFDENGFPDDTMYPLYYKVPGNSSSDIKITDCTHPAAEYYFKKGEEDCTLEVNDQNGLPSSDSSECEIRVREDSRNKVHSSLMYFHRDLTQVDFLCGDPNHSHNSDAPNKHNTLCNGKSITEVVRNSGIDLSGESTGEISFSYVQEKNPSLAIAWQDTDMLNNQTEVVKNSFWRFLYDVPKESKIALYEFSNDVETVKDLDNKNLWPYFHITFTSRKEPCVTCALSKAVNVIKEDDSGTRGYVIIITAANPDAANTNYTEVVQQINSSQLCLIVIGFTNLGATSEGFQELVSASRCGSFWGVSTKEKDDEIFAKLYRAMETVLPSHDTNYVTKIIGTQHVEYGKLLRIQTNEIASKFTLRVGSVFDLSKHFSCIETNGNALVKLSKEGPFSFSFPSQEDDVECSLTTDKLGSVYIQIQMTTKLNQYFEEHTWVKDTTSLASNSPASVDLSTQAQMPVIIYAQINYGGQPVQNAMVKAKVTGPNGNGEWNLDLLDDGLGDPDITANDGIYSRYFLNFNDKGEYTVVITASDNNLQAKIGQNGPQPCCGSKVVSETVPIGAFQEFMKTTFSTISGKPEGGYKPSRILDLHIIAYDMPSKVSLQWTAPGAEADTGQASSYALKLCLKQEDCSGNSSFSSWVKEKFIPKPELYGIKQKATIVFDAMVPKNQTLHIGIQSKNENGKVSELSNLVSLSLMYISPDEMTTTEIPREEEGKSTKSSEIGIIVGSTVIAVFLLIALTAVIYFYVYKPRWQKQTVADKQNSTIIENNSIQKLESSTQPNNYGSSMRKVESFPVLLYTHDQIKDHRSKRKEAPLYTSNVATKPWMSLDPLPNKPQAHLETRSLGSQSTLDVEDEKNSELPEIQQLHDTSQEFVLETGNISKF
ncbi:calcium-activated chloride channel regulator 2-like isoform X1 [Stegodyphus dumicola]|uniref:calcium-activated chloride channel regulator 2-like isoform X1 n=1 Tax=Stegodyphus dumicola TaxID=202533 RepID=UPI0015AD2777|nr:calcium-activated chloride channel regulator 2-like isoform X1 [Stegodyphus dumicola]